MNAVDRWKVVLTLIAIFVAGGVAGGFLTIRAMKFEMLRRSEAPLGTAFAMDRLRARLASHARAGAEVEADRIGRRQ